MTGFESYGSLVGFTGLFMAMVLWYTKVVRPEQQAFEQRSAEERTRTDTAMGRLEKRVEKLEDELEECREEHLAKDVRMARLEVAVILAGGQLPD